MAQTAKGVALSGGNVKCPQFRQYAEAALRGPSNPKPKKRNRPGRAAMLPLTDRQDYSKAAHVPILIRSPIRIETQPLSGAQVYQVASHCNIYSALIASSLVLISGFSCKTMFNKELRTSSFPLYSIKPNLRNLFIKKLTRDRVVPIISASIS